MARKPHHTSRRRHRKKSDARIIFLGLIILVVAIAGAAFTFITMLAAAPTSQALQVTAASCNIDGATLYLKNIGTRNLSATDLAVSKRVTAGLAPDTLRLVWSFTSLPPGGSGTLTDIDCAQTLHPGSTCEYLLSTGGAAIKSTVTC